jgi:hypothetical protein
MTPEEFRAERIAIQKAKCSVCRGTGLEDYDILHSGRIIKLACSRCRDFEDRLDRFCRGFFNAKYVMPRYWHAVYLDKLEPSPDSVLPLERQANLLSLVRDNPDDGYAIFGAPKTGKSTVTVGLYAKVLYHELMTSTDIPGYRLPIRRLSSKTMLDQQQAWATRNLSAGLEEDIPEPEISRDRIIRCFERQGAKFRLFLEEIDKVRETEARRSNLFETLDTLHGCLGQLVITSNLTPQQFAENVGGDFMHRVTAMCKIVNLYE